MKIVILDAKTLGDDIEFSVFNKLGDVSVYQTTSSLQLKDRIKDADIIIVNKIKLNKDNLTDAKKLKLICVTATGYDNIDINYCWHKIHFFFYRIVYHRNSYVKTWYKFLINSFSI